MTARRCGADTQCLCCSMHKLAMAARTKKHQQLDISINIDIGRLMAKQQFASPTASSAFGTGKTQLTVTRKYSLLHSEV